MLNHLPIVSSCRYAVLAPAFVIAALAACSSDATGPTQPEPLPHLEGTMLYTAGASTYRLDPNTGVTRPIMGLDAELGPGGTTYSTADYQSIRVIDLMSGATLDSFNIPDFGLALQQVISHKISPDGSTLAVTGYGPVYHGRSQVMTIDLAAGNPTVRWYFDYSDGGGAIPLVDLVHWLPDGESILLMAEELSRLNYPHTRIQVLKVNLSHGSESFLGAVCHDCYPGLDVTKDGRVISYASGVKSFSFMNLDGTPATGYPSSITGTGPYFSPDDSLVAFTRFTGDSATSGIFVYRFRDHQEWKILGGSGSSTPTLTGWE